MKRHRRPKNPEFLSVEWFHWLIREASGMPPTFPWYSDSDIHRRAERMAAIVAARPTP